MVSITALWLPILLSAVIVFVASWIMHMVFTYHRGDYKKLPGEERILEVMRKEGVGPGNYHFPFAPSPKEMGSPEMREKYNQGPVGLMSIMPSGCPPMGKYLTQWFVFCLLMGVFVAYLTGRTVSTGAEYLAVFRVAGTAAFLGYGLGNITNSIWKGQKWSATIKELIDGLIYGSLTAGTFGTFWPR